MFVRSFVHFSGTKIGLVSKSVSLAAMRNSYFCSLSLFCLNMSKNRYIVNEREQKVRSGSDMEEHSLSETMHSIYLTGFNGLFRDRIFSLLASASLVNTLSSVSNLVASHRNGLQV